MFKKIIVIVLSVTGVGTLPGQYDLAPRLAEYQVGPIERSGIYSEADSIYLDFRVDDAGNQYLVLNNFTDSIISFAGKEGGLMDYKIEAITPNGSWEPLSLFNDVSCGTGYFDYALSPMNRSWSRLRNRVSGSFATFIRHYVYVNGEKYYGAEHQAMINPIYFLSYNVVGFLNFHRQDSPYGNDRSLDAHILKGHILQNLGFPAFDQRDFAKIITLLTPESNHLEEKALKLVELIIYDLYPLYTAQDHLKCLAARVAFSQAIRSDRPSYSFAQRLLNDIPEQVFNEESFQMMVQEIELNPKLFFQETIFPLYELHLLQKEE